MAKEITVNWIDFDSEDEEYSKDSKTMGLKQFKKFFKEIGFDYDKKKLVDVEYIRECLARTNSEDFVIDLDGGDTQGYISEIESFK